MSHTQCDARQRSRFELWSSGQWGHQGAGGINLLVYNAACLINGGRNSTVWKIPHCLIAWLSVAKSVMSEELPDFGDWDNRQSFLISQQCRCFLTTFTIKSNEFFKSLQNCSHYESLNTSLPPKPHSVIFCTSSSLADCPRSASAAIPSSLGPS